MLFIFLEKREKIVYDGNSFLIRIFFLVDIEDFFEFRSFRNLIIEGKREFLEEIGILKRYSFRFLYFFGFESVSKFLVGECVFFMNNYEGFFV